MTDMKHLAAVLFLGLAALAAIPAPARAERNPTCVRYWGQVVSTASGYNHVVVIDNACEKPASCVVSTNVAPDPIQATVPAKQKLELTTFRGSPASRFTPRVACTIP